jgi:hypothetical protein
VTRGNPPQRLFSICAIGKRSGHWAMPNVARTQADACPRRSRTAVTSSTVPIRTIGGTAGIKTANQAATTGASLNNG